MFDLIAEQKIAEAVERGELDDLPGAGRPLELDDDALVPEDLRLACRILKNAGYMPAEVAELNDIAQLERLVAAGEVDAEAHAKALRRLALLRTRIETRYYRQVLGKLSR
ncbi:MAG TPA: DnaJ family domain-containing protein [Burkholderiales bacterium]